VADEGISSEPAQTGVRSLARAGVRTWPVGGAQWGAYSAGTQVIVPKNAGRCWIT